MGIHLRQKKFLYFWIFTNSHRALLSSRLASYLLPPWPPKKGGNLKNPPTTKLSKYDFFFYQNQACMQKMSPVASKLSELWQFLYTKVT